MTIQKKVFPRVLFSFLLILAFSLWSDPVLSQDKYPTRAVDVIISVTPGAGIDLTARVIASYCHKKWGVPVNCINKPGGNNVPACLEVHKATPDGYTLLCDSLATSSAMVVVPNLPFKIMDRTFLGTVAVAPLLLMVPSTSPYKTLEEVAEAARKDPGNFVWASLGGASPPDYMVRQFFEANKIDVRKTKPVMTRGGSEATSLTAGGHVQLSANTTAGSLASFKSGMIRPLGVSGKNRHPDYPDLPTFTELSYPTLGVQQWYGISGPPKIALPVIDICDKAFQEMVKDPDIISKMKNLGLTPVYLNASATQEVVLKDMQEMQKLFTLK
jgi:tripartite-type tricarboxylate transporter receptor subunit TctC